MNAPLISVIVPIYNVERYLRKCVDSILHQTYSNLEILLVDDGSPDGCPAICDEYAAQDSRIKVIHKKNGGLSDARNAALDVMQGEYVTFVDSDDYIANDYVETLYHLLHENSADISCIQFTKVHEGDIPSNISSNDVFEVLTPYEALRKLLYFDGLETCAHGKLYKASLFDDIRYPDGKLFEDLGTTYKLFLKSSMIVNSNAKKYYYLQRKNSIETSSFSPKKMDLLEMCDKLRDDVLKQYPDLVSAWACRFISANFHLIFQIPKHQFPYEMKILSNNIKKYRKIVLFDHNARKKARAAAFLSYFGINFTHSIWLNIKRRGLLK
jgi:glycosyltransferase involved in cell wall biosynthesis